MTNHRTKLYTSDIVRSVKLEAGIVKKITQIILLVSVLWFLVSNCHAEEAVSSTELINNAKEYDGKVVLYKGEVIGDIMARKGFAWMNVNDGVNAIGIWTNKDLAKDILYTGGYKSRGDIVEVKGVFHRACLEHGGDLDIHIDELRKINSGMVIRERLDIAKRKVAFVLLAILCIVVILSNILRASEAKFNKKKKIK